MSISYQFGDVDAHGALIRAQAASLEAEHQSIVRDVLAAGDFWGGSGSGWSGTAEATSYDTMGQMNQAFRNIVNMLHGVRDGLIRDANNYEQQEQASQQILSS